MLTLHNVSKRYKDKIALDGVTLTLESGVYGLLGPNGAGKSTMMDIITGDLRPTGGSVEWDGTDIQIMGAAYRSLLGYVPQQQGLYDTFSGRRFLSYMATLKGISRREQAAEISRVLSCVDMAEAADRRIGTYSGGMKQRLLIAQAILGDPKLVVLDEPTAGLDPKERVRLREQIAALAKGRIVLLSTHVVSDIAPIAREVILLRSGRVVDRGTVERLCESYQVPGLENVYMRIFGEEDDHDPADRL